MRFDVDQKATATGNLWDGRMLINTTFLEQIIVEAGNAVLLSLLLKHGTRLSICNH